MQEKELTALLWLGGVVLSIIGSLLSVGGAVSYWIFRTHKQDNDSVSEQVDDHEVRLTKIETEHKIFKERCCDE